MKFLNRILLLGTVFFIFYACKKDEQRAILDQGTSAPVLKASSTALILDSGNASTKTAITFSANAVDFGATIAPTYVLQIDSIAGNFARPVNITLSKDLSKSYTVLEFNTLATSLGLVPGVAGKMHARIKTDVTQSNGVASSIPTSYSNVIDLTVTPYSVKPKPLYPVPDDLFIVGDATPGQWDNPVPTPAQKFTRIDENSFGLVLQLTGGKEFLLLPKNGDWSHKYAVTGTANPGGGTFVPDASKNMAGPAATGLYKIIVDFVKATYSITPAASGSVPTNLYIVGDATAGQWNNPVPTPSQQFTRVSNGEFSITIPLTAGKSYVFLPVNGDWAHKYGGTGKTGGPLLADSAVPGSNTPAPDVSGSYKITVNFFSNQYSVK